MTVPPALVDIALLIGRVLLGVVFFAHGWQKLFTNGIDGTASFFEQSGVPMPVVAAGAAAVLELVGGALLVLGLVGALGAGCLLLLALGGGRYSVDHQLFGRRGSPARARY